MLTLTLRRAEGEAEASQYRLLSRSLHLLKIATLQTGRAAISPRLHNNKCARFGV
jgi:hypothetical protein